VNLWRKFDYDPDTGVLIWRKTGKEAGWVSEKGYRRVSIMGKSFMATHIIWCMMTGSYPDEDMVIDHINRDRLDNRWDNLRQANRSINGLNSKNRGNATEVRGAYKYVRGGYISRIRINGQLRVAYFQTAEEAGAWYAHMRATALETGKTQTG